MPCLPGVDGQQTFSGDGNSDEHEENSKQHRDGETWILVPPAGLNRRTSTDCPPAESGIFFLTEKDVSLQSTDFTAIKVTG